MARGWESKSVESQIESAKSQNGQHSGAAGNSAEEKQKKIEHERQGLLLSRAYVLQRIESSSSEVYTQSLRQALAEIESKLAQLKTGN